VQLPVYATEDDFIAAPVEEVARFAPVAMAFAPGGTRRDAEIAGVDSESERYVRWSLRRTFDLFEMLFRNGVRHAWSGTITPNQWNESGPYRDSLIRWVARHLFSEETLEEYNRRGWRVRLVGWKAVPELAEAAAQLEARTPRQAKHTLWWWTFPSYEFVWEQILATTHRSGAQTRDELIQALYGEPLPLVTMYVGFGKPEVSPVHLPPLLAGQVQCYWTTRPGYSLDEREFRRIIYDYAFLRPTWQPDKTGRASRARRFKDAWLNGPTIGLGQRLADTFWYPASMEIPPASVRPSDDDD
jgi:hypothetical protein